MKAFIDSRLKRRGDFQGQIAFNWPSLLHHLDVGPLFESFPCFDEKNSLFAFIISALNLGEDRELLIRLYDQVFVECLTHVKAMPQVNPNYLIDRIHKKQNSPFKEALDLFEKRLVEDPYHTMHDLTLYLAWDRICVNLAVLFESVLLEAKALEGLDVLKECLIESFQHITAQGRTTPGFFRLVEALYAYHLREERLETHTESEWLILCQSATVLTSREALVDLSYIDECMSDFEKPAIKVFTMDSLDKVVLRVALAQCMIEKLKKEHPEWRCVLSLVEVVSVKDEEQL